MNCLPSREAISMILDAFESYDIRVFKRIVRKIFWYLHRNGPTQNVTRSDLSLVHPECYPKDENFLHSCEPILMILGAK